MSDTTKGEIFASNQLLVTSLWLLVTSYLLLVGSDQSLVPSRQLRVVQSLVASHQLRVVSHQLLVTSYQLLVTAPYYQLLQIICEMKFARYQNLFSGHLYLNAIALNSMMSFLFQEYSFPKTLPNVQKQPFSVVLHEAVLKNFTAKHRCRTLIKL